MSSESKTPESEPAAKRSKVTNPFFKLLDGNMHPMLGFGTYKIGFVPASASCNTGAKADAPKGPTAAEIFGDVIATGLYPLLDCAQFYGNEAEVGKAIKASDVPREKLYLVSKVWNNVIEAGPEAVRKQLQKTLDDLQTDYIDLYLIHWPVPGKHVQAYKALQPLVKEGKIKSLGVSNYTVEDYKELMESEGVTVVPVVNQIEINPFLYRKNTIDFFQSKGVLLHSYRALRNGAEFKNPALVKIADKHKCSVAQILGRWCVQKGCVYIPKTSKQARMAENASVFHFELDKDDLQILDNLTTPAALETYRGLYAKCVNRDTSKNGTMEGVKTKITLD